MAKPPSRALKHQGWPVIWIAGCSALLAACGETADPGGGPGDSLVTRVELRLVSSIPIPPQFGVHDTFIRDGIAFVCAWNTGLIIYDVGNGIRGGTPAAPVEVSRIVTDDRGVAGGPAVHNAWWFHNPETGERRYVFVGQEGPAIAPTLSTGDIHVVDISDIANPVEVAFYHMDVTPEAGTHNFWMDEEAQVLFAAYYNGGVVAIDVSGHLSGNLAFREIARIAPGTNPYFWGVQLSGRFLYATDFMSGLYQLNWTGHSLSVAGGGNNVIDRFTSDLWVHGEYAYTGTWGKTPRNGRFGDVLNVWHLDPDGAPDHVGTVLIDSITAVSDVKGSDDGVLLVVSAEGGPNAGLHIFSLADPAHPELLRSERIAAGVHTAKVATIGGRHYVFAARNPGVDPPAPQWQIYEVTLSRS